MLTSANQITCDGTRTIQAPSGCFQYYFDTAGTIASYNYDGGQYFSDMHYRNCQKKRKIFSAVENICLLQGLYPHEWPGVPGAVQPRRRLHAGEVEQLQDGALHPGRGHQPVIHSAN